MENVDSGLVGLNWRERGDYPALDGLCKRMTFGDALNLVVSFGGVSMSDGEVDGLESVVPSPGLMRDDDSLISARAETWDAVMKDLLTSDFPASSGGVCMQLSNDLGVVSGLKAEGVSGALSGIFSQNPEELSRLYHSTTLLILLRERIAFGRVPYVEPRSGGGLPDDLRHKLSGILSGPPIPDSGGRESDVRDVLLLNHEVLQKYRRHFGKYPIERALRQDPERISEYCYALSRLVLGKSEDFSDVLQEAFVLEEITSLSQRYFPKHCGGESLWDAEILEVVEQLRDLRVRAFEHNCLMTCRVPTSGIITPPGGLVGPDTGVAVDFGSGLYSRFFNAVARGNPDCECFAVDQKIPDEYDLSHCGSPNMHFVHGDFDDKSQVERLASRFAGNIGMVNLSNILHKLRDPMGFLRVVFGKMLKEHGKVSVCMPAISGFADASGRHVGMKSLVAMGREDDTSFWESFLTIEMFLEFIRSTSNSKIMSIAFADPRLSENDMAKRMFVSLRRD